MSGTGPEISLKGSLYCFNAAGKSFGFDDTAILQITLIAAWFNYINRVADSLGTGRSGSKSKQAANGGRRCQIGLKVADAWARRKTCGQLLVDRAERFTR